MMSYFGIILLVFSAILYYLQSKEDMFETMRPFVILTNLLTFIWFIFLQYYRFRDSGRACSGDFLTTEPANFKTVYLGDEGQWIQIFIVAQYTLYILCKIVSLIITNRLEAEFEQKKA
mmetsp:Transcript_36801/g.56344  ORF Transcript_36801/g.56344 Transcript_36801/m.56344 type:complete len:118 (+) Transcript_36801:227-580(+)